MKSIILGLGYTIREIPREEDTAVYSAETVLPPKTPKRDNRCNCWTVPVGAPVYIFSHPSDGEAAQTQPRKEN